MALAEFFANRLISLVKKSLNKKQKQKTFNIFNRYQSRYDLLVHNNHTYAVT